MYQNQNRTAALVGAGAGMANAAAVPERPRLFAQIDQLTKTLSHCHESVSGLDRAADRLIGTVPQDAGTAEKAPAADTLERRLIEAIQIADALANRLHQVESRFALAV